MLDSKNKLYIFLLVLLTISVILLDNAILKIILIILIFGGIIFDIIYNYKLEKNDFDLIIEKIQKTMFVSKFQYEQVIKQINVFKDLFYKLNYNETTDCYYQFTVLNGLMNDIMYNYFSIILKSERNDKIVDNLNELGKELFDFLQNKLDKIKNKCNIQTNKIDSLDLKKLKKNYLIYDYNYII